MACSLCQLGKYQGSAGQASCLDCDPGTFNAIEGQQLCALCTAGRYQPKSESSSCRRCPIGTLQPAAGQTSCDTCEPGKYSDGNASAFCTLCPLERYSTAGSAACDFCAPNYFWHPRTQICEECGVDLYEGAACPTSGLELSSLMLKPGYWRASEDSDEFFLCGSSDAFCVGGNTSASICSPGHRGPWCRLCESGWHLNPDGSCAKCDLMNEALLFTLLAICVIGAVVIIRTIQRLIAHLIRQSSAQSENNHEDVWIASAENVHKHGDRVNRATIVKLTIIFLQIMTSMADVYDASFPEPLASTLYFFRWPLMDFPVDTIPFSCTTVGRPSFYVTLIMMTLGPLLLCGARRISFERARDFHERAGVLMHQEGQATADIIFVLYLFQPTATRTAFLTFICTERFDDGSKYLLEDPNLSCDSTAHTVMTVYAALMVAIWPVGITCFYCILLYGHINILRVGSEEKEERLLISGMTAKKRASAKRGDDSPAASGALLIAFSQQISAFLDQNQNMDVSRLFTRLDRDGDGMLSRKDVLWALQYLDVPTIHWEREQEVDRLMQQLEENNKFRGVRLDDFMDVVEFSRECHPHLGGIELLVSGYKPYVWFWELLICVERLMATAVLVVFYRGAAIQALSGLIIALSMASAQAYVSPFENQRENNLSLLAHSQIFLANLAVLSFKLEPATTENKPAIWTLTIITIYVLAYAMFVTALRIRHEFMPVLLYVLSTLKSAPRNAAHRVRASFRAKRGAILVFHVDSDDEVDRSEGSSSDDSESDDNNDGGTMMPTNPATMMALADQSSNDNATDIAQNDDSDEERLTTFMSSMSPTVRDPDEPVVHQEFDITSTDEVMKFLESLDEHDEEAVQHIMETLHASGSLSEQQVECIQEALSRSSDQIATNRHRNEMEDDDDDDDTMTDSDDDDDQEDGGAGALEDDDGRARMDFDASADMANRALVDNTRRKTSRVRFASPPDL